MDARESRLRAVAQRQHDVFTLGQAMKAGFTHAAVGRRRRSGRWEELEPRVFRVRVATAPSWHQRLMALVLATDGVASGRAAAALYGLIDADQLEVLVLRHRRGRRHHRHEVRSTGELARVDAAVVQGIPSTTPARTLIDLAATMPEAEFEDLLDRALVQRVVDRNRLRRRAEALRHTCQRGSAVVLRLLAERHPQLHRARNEWEALVLRLCRRFGLPEPIPNYRVFVGGRWREIDAAWPDHKVAVEFDGFVPHSTRRQFDDDRARQNDLVDDDWKPFRLTKTALTADPVAAFGPVARALGG